MGYLEKASGLDNFTKAVISFGFRVDPASIDAAKAQYNSEQAAIQGPDGGSFTSQMMGMLPLLTFGPMGEVSHLTGGSIPIAPSLIGLMCTPDDAALFVGGTPGVNSLFVRLQTGVNLNTPTEDLPLYGADFFEVGGFGNDYVQGGTFVVGRNYQNIPVSADTWHHVLVSFDLSNGGSTTLSGTSLTVNAASKFYWAFDDVNYNDAYLFPNTAGFYSGTTISVSGATGPNDIWSAWSSYWPDGSNSLVLPPNTPVIASPVGAPGSSVVSSFIPHVEMARLQVFTGISIDTSVLDNRRAFITAGGTPANASLARALLGKRPEIEFLTTADWIAGNNTGTAGPFIKTGTATAFASPVYDITP